MLCFIGDAFAFSSFLQEEYTFFLPTHSSVLSFMTIESVDDQRAALFALSDKLFDIQNFSLGTANTPDKYYIKCINCRMTVDSDFARIKLSQAYLEALSVDSYNQLNEGIYQVARFRALYLDMLVLHASAVVYQDEVLLFSGMKGAGKSTQARLWLENTDAWVLNYDKPVAGLAGERVMISGSPWGGKEDLSINEVRPAKALFFVHQAKENRVELLSPAKAYSQAYLNYFVYPLNQDLEDRYHHAITQLVQKVPVYDLYCTDTAQAVEAVKHALYQREE